ncbi:unnamed protein product [Phaeothamnion confervicola]
MFEAPLGHYSAKRSGVILKRVGWAHRTCRTRRPSHARTGRQQWRHGGALKLEAASLCWFGGTCRLSGERAVVPQLRLGIELILADERVLAEDSEGKAKLKSKMTTMVDHEAQNQETIRGVGGAPAVSVDDLKAEKLKSPAVLAFKNLKVVSKAHNRVLLKDVSGQILGGLLAVMGPSGEASQ